MAVPAGGTPAAIFTGDIRCIAGGLPVTDLTGAFVKAVTPAGALTVQLADGTEGTVQLVGVGATTRYPNVSYSVTTGTITFTQRSGDPISVNDLLAFEVPSNIGGSTTLKITTAIGTGAVQDLHDLSGNDVFPSALTAGDWAVVIYRASERVLLAPDINNEGLNQNQVDARIAAGVLDWAEDGDSSGIPRPKITGGLVHVAGALPDYTNGVLTLIIVDAVAAGDLIVFTTSASQGSGSEAISIQIQTVVRALQDNKAAAVTSAALAAHTWYLGAVRSGQVILLGAIAGDTVLLGAYDGHGEPTTAPTAMRRMEVDRGGRVYAAGDTVTAHTSDPTIERTGLFNSAWIYWNNVHTGAGHPDSVSNNDGHFYWSVYSHAFYQRQGADGIVRVTWGQAIHYIDGLSGVTIPASFTGRTWLGSFTTFLSAAQELSRRSNRNTLEWVFVKEGGSDAALYIVTAHTDGAPVRDDAFYWRAALVTLGDVLDSADGTAGNLALVMNDGAMNPRIVRVIDGTVEHPAPASGYANRLRYDPVNKRLDICRNVPHVQGEQSGTWADIPDRTDLLVEESRQFVSDPTVGEYVFDAGADRFYIYAVVFDSGNFTEQWIETIPSDALQFSRTADTNAVRFLGELSSDADAIAALPSIAPNTDYFYVHIAVIRRLDLTSYVAPGSVVAHWQWLPATDLDSLDFAAEVLGHRHAATAVEDGLLLRAGANRYTPVLRNPALDFTAPRAAAGGYGMARTERWLYVDYHGDLKLPPLPHRQRRRRRQHRRPGRHDSEFPRRDGHRARVALRLWDRPDRQAPLRGIPRVDQPRDPHHALRRRGISRDGCRERRHDHHRVGAALRGQPVDPRPDGRPRAGGRDRLCRGVAPPRHR